jgi:NADH:ubiquinone oxidoreductase subunit 3 (subunit A)
MSTGALILGIVLGLVLPLIANILPIKRALSKNLRESLDMYHRSVNELQVSIKRLEEMGFSLNQMIVALLLVLLGGIVYYLAPLAWVYENYSLFFFVINFILIMMILGLAFVSILLLPYIQLLFLNLFLLIMRSDRILYQVVKKNLESHEGRNTKTAMMFTVALSFLIFAGSTFDLIGNLVTSQLVGVLGADVYITSLLS